MTTARTVLDLYRVESETASADHYVHVTLDGRHTVDGNRFLERTAALANGLEKLGIAAGDRVMLLSDNRPEWQMVDLAVADLGAVDVPVYETLIPEQIAYQARDSGATAAVVENPEQMEKFLAIRGDCPELEHLIQIEGGTAHDVVPLEEITDGGRSGDAVDAFWRRAQTVEAEDLLTIIYTSGTTGNPKGVMLTHGNLVSNVRSAIERAPVSKDDFALEFLPLCHSFERMLGYTYMAQGVPRAYCSIYDVGALIADIKPTVFAGVPRFYEKVYEQVMERIGSASPLRRAIFRWARQVGSHFVSDLLRGEEPRGLAYAAADRLVLSKVREGLGGRVRFCISGGAPLAMFLNEFFHSMGVRILEGYGLTETSPVIAVNGLEPGQTRLGTVGRPITGVETFFAEDGELCVKGPNLMKGYWNLDEATAEAFDPDGAFHTGDVGEADEDGFIRITDRKKDLLVTAGGKNVAPQPIENRLKESPLVDNAVLVGDCRRFVAVLISPAPEEVERWAAAQGVQYESVEDLYQHPRLRSEYAHAVEKTNADLARYEQIKKFAVLPITLSVEGGQLTPTLKVKRRVVEDQFGDVIDGLYEE